PTVDSRSAIAAFRVASDVGMLAGSVAAGAALGAFGGASAFGLTAVALALLAAAVSRGGESESSPRPDPRLLGAPTASDAAELVGAGSNSVAARQLSRLVPSIAR
ncbi:MAG: hypothetical protein QOE36_590, partial [Gaiellaceae bacterium]|nr:hypothetical protein [Gaiellaceae bacterium]